MGVVLNQEVDRKLLHGLKVTMLSMKPLILLDGLKLMNASMFRDAQSIFVQTAQNGMKMNQNWCQKMNDQVKLKDWKPDILKNKINVAFMLRKLAGVGTVYEHDETSVKWWKLTVNFGNKEYYICFQYYLTKPGVDRVDIRDTSTWKALKVTEIKWLESQLKQKLNGTQND